MGSLALLMLQHMTGGQWGLVGRRVFEAASRILPLVALMFVPLLFGLPALYLWARPEAVAADAVLQAKQPYLNVPFFIGRAALYFGVWLLGSVLSEHVVRGAGSRRSGRDAAGHAALPQGERTRPAPLRRS